MKCAFVIVLWLGCIAAAPSYFTPFGLSAGDTMLHRNDDETSSKLTFPGGFKYFGSTRVHLWLANNGLFSFDAPVEAFTPVGLDNVTFPIVAPYWGDVDTRPSNSGEVWFRISTSGSDIDDINTFVRATMHQSTFTGTRIFVATWDSVGYFDKHVDKRCTFQAILVADDFGSTYAIFNYGTLQWTTGDASEGVNGFGGVPAVAGFSNGDRVTYSQIPGSKTNSIINLTTKSNVNINGVPQTGRFVFQVSEGVVISECCDQSVPPVLLGVPTDLNVSLPSFNDLPPVTDNVQAEIRCLGSQDPNFVIVADLNVTTIAVEGCPITRRWVAIDGCLRTAQVIQTFNYPGVNNDPLVVDFPADAFASCTWYDVDVTGEPSSDNNGVHYDYVDRAPVLFSDYESGCASQSDPNFKVFATMSRDWTAYDDCGRQVFGSQEITLLGGQDPAVSVYDQCMVPNDLWVCFPTAIIPGGSSDDDDDETIVNRFTWPTFIVGLDECNGDTLPAYYNFDCANNLGQTGNSSGCVLLREDTLCLQAVANVSSYTFSYTVEGFCGNNVTRSITFNVSDNNDCYTPDVDIFNIRIVPPSWTCNENYYGSNDGCDCQCGAPDPDCLDGTQDVLNCPGSSGAYICFDGEYCVPSDWTCDSTSFGQDSYCDCNCGSAVQDPDCNSGYPVAGCPRPTDICVQGYCTDPSIPPDWGCLVSQWNTSDGCQCECSALAIDPDCLQPSQPLENCPDPTEYICEPSTFRCLPVDWSCDVEWFSDETCDCNCTASDIYDCEILSPVGRQVAVLPTADLCDVFACCDATSAPEIIGAPTDLLVNISSYDPDSIPDYNGTVEAILSCSYGNYFPNETSTTEIYPDWILLEEGCPIKRSWSVQDDCERTTEVVQIFAYPGAYMGPLVIAVPEDYSGSCGDISSSVTGQASADFNDASIYYDDNWIFNDNCNASDIENSVYATINRTWFAEEPCGNTASGSQLLTVTGLPMQVSTTDQCFIPNGLWTCFPMITQPDLMQGRQLLGSEFIYAEDGCTGDYIPAQYNYDCRNDHGNSAGCVEIPYDPETMPLGFGGIVCLWASETNAYYNFSFTVDGPCGQSETRTITFNVIDDNDCIEPVADISDFFNVPPGWTCDEEMYSDGICQCNCGAEDIDCVDLGGGVIGRQTNMCDECCDSSPDPVFSGAPTDLSITISSFDVDLLPVYNVEAAISCYSGNFDPEVQETVDIEPSISAVEFCPIVRTWSVEDGCGRTAEVVQTISYPGAFFGPLILAVPTTAEANCSYYGPLKTGFATSNQPEATIDYSDHDFVYSTECKNQPEKIYFVFNRTWTVSSPCGEVLSGVQHIKVLGNSPPDVQKYDQCIIPNNLWFCVPTTLLAEDHEIVNNRDFYNGPQFINGYDHCSGDRLNATYNLDCADNFGSTAGCVVVNKSLCLHAVDAITFYSFTYSVEGQCGGVVTKSIKFNIDADTEECWTPDVSLPSGAVTVTTKAIASGNYITTRGVDEELPPNTQGSESQDVVQGNGNGGTVAAATIPAVLGGFLLLGTALAAVFYCRKKKYAMKEDDDDAIDIETFSEGNTAENADRVGLDAPISGGALLAGGAIAALGQKNKDWMIPYDEIEIGGKLGAGAFGTVYQGTWRGTDVAVKTITKSDLTEQDISEFLRELVLMKNLRPHTNVITLFGFCTSPLAIVTEFCANGSLYDLLHGEKKLSEETIFGFVRGIAAGMLHLHSEGIIHRDLACRNILLHGDVVKVSDFGMSRITQKEESNKTKTTVGPLKWMSPESLNDRIYGPKTDIYSFGVVLYEILTRQNPYDDMESLEAAIKVASGELSILDELPEGVEYPPTLLRLMKDCVQFDPANRPDFEAVVSKLS